MRCKINLFCRQLYKVLHVWDVTNMKYIIYKDKKIVVNSLFKKIKMVYNNKYICSQNYQWTRMTFANLLFIYAPNLTCLSLSNDKFVVNVVPDEIDIFLSFKILIWEAIFSSIFFLQTKIMKMKTPESKSKNDLSMNKFVHTIYHHT